MVFWGVEVKPGEQYTPDEDGEYEGSRLHLSQATLGLECKGKERTVVKCKVGDGPELLLCSLTPGVSESCSLDLLFDQDVVFSVAGSTSVHLVGYYMPLDDEEEDDDYEFEGSEFDSEDDMDEEDSEMDDMDVPPSSVKITELDEDGNPTISDETAVGKKNKSPVSDDENQKTLKKRKRAAEKKETEKRNKSSKDVNHVTVEEASEDEDGFPISSEKAKGMNGSEENLTEMAATTSKEAKKDKKKKKKTDKKEEATVQTEAAEKTPKKAVKENGSEGQTPTKKQPTNGSTGTPGTDSTGKKVKKTSVRKFPNGLEIEEIAMGRPDAKSCKPGKKVSVHYTGKLKSNGKVFDSNVGKKPFGFRLGVGEVVKGWDVGVAGMRVGDKRRITVPPAMGYGAKGTGPIPGNAWLVFDVEVVDVGN